MLTYQQFANPVSWTTMNTFSQPGGGLIDGYALVVGTHADGLQKLTALLWEHGVPAYAAPGVDAPDKTVAARGRPAFILLHMDRLDATAVMALETFRMRHDVPLLCIAPADAQPPHVQALLQMASDFIVAPYQPAELLLRIRRVCAAARSVQLPPQSFAGAIPASAKRPAPLTQTERAILNRLSETLGEPVPLDELAALIPGDTDAARVRLLRVHIFRLRQKIEPMPKNPTYVRTVRDYGYYLTEKVEGLG